MKIGVSTYSYNQYITSGKMTALDTIRKAKEMGFDGIEVVAETLPQPVTDEYLREIRKEADEVGIELTAYLTGASFIQDTEEEREAALAKVFRRLEEASILGVKLFRFDVAHTLPRFLSFEKALKRVAPYVRRVAERGAELGIMTMSENHGYVFQDWDRMERLYDEVNSENYTLLVDIGNFMCTDFDNVLSVSKLAHLASHVHVKDMKIVDFYDEGSKKGLFNTRAMNYLRATVLGEGDARVARCIEILRKAGFDGYLDIEYEACEDCIQGIAKGYEFLKDIV